MNVFGHVMRLCQGIDIVSARQILASLEPTNSALRLKFRPCDLKVDIVYPALNPTNTAIMGMAILAWILGLCRVC